MKKIFFSTLVIVLVFCSHAQQETQFSMYYQNPYFFNPAAGGLTKTMQFDFGFRRQWLAIEGSPLSLYATGHSQIKFDQAEPDVVGEFNVERENVYATPPVHIGKNKHVVGGRALTDLIGPFTKNSLQGSYAYHLRFTSKTMLALGMSAGFSSYGINSNKVIMLDQDDVAYETFLLRNNGQTIFDVNAGLTFYSENYIFGISSIQLLDNDMVIDQVVTNSTYGRHWFMFGQYNFAVNDKIGVEPHFMGQLIGGAPFAFNFGTRFIFDKRYWGNLALRFGDAFNFGFGMNIYQNFRFGYAFDLGIGTLGGVSGNAHELQIGYTLGNNRNLAKEIDEKDGL
jgi:type IX secretion system PorP/SprF family membrane protein